MHIKELPADYALVLQQVDEYGEEDFQSLAETLSLDNARLSHIIQSLSHKGLVRIRYTAQDVWIQLSHKGQRFISNLWPEAQHMRFSH